MWYNPSNKNAILIELTCSGITDKPGIIGTHFKLRNLFLAISERRRENIFSGVVFQKGAFAFVVENTIQNAGIRLRHLCHFVTHRGGLVLVFYYHGALQKTLTCLVRSRQAPGVYIFFFRGYACLRLVGMVSGQRAIFFKRLLLIKMYWKLMSAT